MATQRIDRRGTDERGYVLVGVLVIAAICLLLTTSMLQTATSSASIRKVVNTNTKNFYAVERSINAVTAWLQANSKNLVNAFNSSNFSNNFDLTAPSVGNNQGTNFPIPTLIKMKGTSDSVQLTNSSYFGTSSFPNTTNIDTGTSFNPVSTFQSANFGSGVNVRLLAIWALSTDGHYQPIFRVDAVTGGSTPERGVHGLNFIKSHLVTGAAGVGFYTDMGDFQTGNTNNTCWSYQWTWSGTAWSKGAQRSNCILTGRDDMAFKAAWHGNVSTKKSGGVNLDGGSISGTKCQGASCAVTYVLPTDATLPTWTSRCSSGTSLTATANPQNLASGTTLAAQCFDTLTVPSNKAFKFTDTSNPYYIKTLDLQNNSNSQIQFATIPPGQKYKLYIDTIVGNKINGNQWVATNLAPNQLEIYLTKTNTTLDLQGTAAIHGVLMTKGNSTVKVTGNFVYHGAIRTDALSMTGNGSLGYDEGLGGSSALSDINFTLFKASQRYR